ncbi:DUF58 domain-containing protein [Ornithinibacillus halophilus]|uniref:Uncharacterized conserved protein, DUF58 family, contains vWF domain n=1 Tax=Ornithinibacillus halophilus TaxID=930117 RepID=A0A1M5HD99_9BACI|nr:DUF58 domain-containing protein [Ornithinibacillus halophilus]SHG13930.1 Uncharacterized conserved protein, DUF58 family, contains vWF domain [Ornithinibacillus halophilus]
MKGTFRFIGNFVFIVTLFGILFSYAMFQGGFVSWFLFFGFLPIFLYHIGLLFYPVKNWKVSRKLTKHVVRAGDTVSVKIIIERKIPFPLYYCICEEFISQTLNRVDSRQEKYRYLEQPNKLFNNRKIKKMIFPWFKRRIELSYRLEQVPRGEHAIHAVRIRTGDVFGMIKKQHVFPVTSEIIAYPNERNIHLSEKITSFEQGSVTAQTFNLKNTNVATGIREYMPGDRFSWIDWKQTAKKNDVMTKEFEQEKSTDTLIVLDGCFHDGLNPLAFEATVEVSLSLMETIRKQASQVGFLSIGETNTFFPVQHDPTKHEGIRKHLTSVEPARTNSFAKKLKEEMLKITNSFYVIIVTSHMDDALKDTVQKIKYRKKRASVVYAQSKNAISESEHKILRQLRNEGIGVTILTEDELVTNPIEVKTL